MEHIALIVDDDRPTLIFLEQVLRPTGIHVQMAEDGLQAMEVLETLTPTMLLLDMLMPRLGGLELLDYIVRTPRLDDMFVAIISAHQNFPPGPQTERINAFFLKPIRPKELREATRNVMASGGVVR